MNTLSLDGGRLTDNGGSQSKVINFIDIFDKDEDRQLLARRCTLYDAQNILKRDLKIFLNNQTSALQTDLGGFRLILFKKT
jgi:hypothetical protein